MSPKPEVVLEFDLGDVMMMRPPFATASAPSPKDTMLIRQTLDSSKVAIYIVFDGARVVPVAVAEGTKIELTVSR